MNNIANLVISYHNKKYDDSTQNLVVEYLKPNSNHVSKYEPIIAVDYNLKIYSKA